MALDSNVQPKVYRLGGENGGDKYVVASGGEFVVESGGTQTIDSGGAVNTTGKIAALTGGGEVEIQSGGVLDFQSGGTGFFGSQAITADELKFDFLSRQTVTQHASADISAGSVLSPAYGIHIFSAVTGLSKASAAWPAGNSGAMLELNFPLSIFSTDANISIVISTSATVYPLGSGAAISNIQVSAGGFLRAIVIATDTWSIVERNESVSVQALV